MAEQVAPHSGQLLTGVRDLWWTTEQLQRVAALLADFTQPSFMSTLPRIDLAPPSPTRSRARGSGVRRGLTGCASSAC